MNEKLAEAVHDAWWKEKKAAGFHAPLDCPTLDADDTWAKELYENAPVPNKTRFCVECHPDMIPYSELPENIKEYDRVTVRTVLDAMGVIDDDLGEVSDGYHTFNELYEFRKLYNACLFNSWFKQDLYKVHKSTRHSDGELCFGGGWFIVMASTPAGQISNHYEMKDWLLFSCPVYSRADEWDGHTTKDVVTTLKQLAIYPMEKR